MVKKLIFEMPIHSIKRPRTSPQSTTIDIFALLSSDVVVNKRRTKPVAVVEEVENQITF